MKIILGLGNPGTEYAHTRHNAGFDVLDRIAATNAVEWAGDSKRKANVVKMQIDGTAVLLAKPTTYMNESGDALQALASYYKVTPEDILVVHDEMDLSTGRLAFLKSGGDAGHNGIADIQERMATKEIPRLRVGVGRPTGMIPKEDWVLGKATGEAAKQIQEAINNAAEAAIDWVKDGLAKAMNAWN